MSLLLNAKKAKVLELKLKISDLEAGKPVAQ